VRNYGVAYLSTIVWEVYLVDLLLSKIKRKHSKKVDDKKA